MPTLELLWKPFYLLFLFFQVKAKECIEWFKIAFLYYTKSSGFLLRDAALRLRYFLSSPYSVHARYLRASGADTIYTYGETPLTTLACIMAEADVTKGDVVYELGSGSGRAVMWLGCVLGCSAIGIEIVPGLVSKSQWVMRCFPCERIHFMEGDFTLLDYSLATILYLNGTCMEDQAIQTLIKTCLDLEVGTKIITTSFSLLEYAPDAPFALLKEIEVPFYWGRASVFIHEKN